MAKHIDQKELENGGGLLRPDLAYWVYGSFEASMAENNNESMVRSSGTLICVEANCDDGTSFWFADAEDCAGEYFIDQEFAAVKKAIENMSAEGTSPKLFRKN